MARSIVIGEINWAGSEHSTADEWVELWNLGTDTQSLNGWKLQGATSDPLTFNESHLIKSQEAFLIANYAENEKRSALSVQPDLVTTEVSLANTALYLVLLDAEEQVVDEAGSGATPPAGQGEPPSSMLRQDTTIDGTKSEAWITNTKATNLDATSTGYGTPRLCDVCETASTTSTITTSTTSIANTTTTIPNPSATSATTTTDALFINETSSTTAETTTSTILFTSSTRAVDDATPSSTQVNTTSTLDTFSATSSSDLATFTATSTPQEQETTPVTNTLILAATTASSPEPESSPPPPCAWHLATVFPAPSDGPEWIEITGCLLKSSLTEGWAIEDPGGRILLIQATTPIQDIDNARLRIHLPGQHLRNTGDTVILRGPEGGIYDIVTYPSLKRDEHYTKREDGTWWIPERTTQEVSNSSTIASVTPSAPPVITPLPSSPSPPTAQTTITPSAPKKPTTTPPLKTSPPIFSLSYEEYKTPSPPAKKPVPKVSNLSPSRKTTKKTSPSMPKNQPPRIRIQGVVGTPPGLIGKQRFILLNTEGKGLLIHANNKQPSPPLNTSVEITGSLVYNDNDAYLSMRSDDRWIEMSKKLPSPKLYANDLETSSAENSWSLIDITGQVQGSTRASIKLVIGDKDIEVSIPRSLNYRAERLQKGDIVRIQGVINTQPEIPRLYPRLASEIVIEERAQMLVKTPSNTNNTLPPWVPVSAATTTIAGGYGLKRLQQWREQRRLEKQLEASLQELSSLS